MKEDLKKCGYTDSQLDVATTRAVEKLSNDSKRSDEDYEPIILATLYFKNSYKLRKLLHELTDDIKLVTGCNITKPILAHKRGKNIKDNITRNKDFARPAVVNSSQHDSQRCTTRGCKTCELLDEALSPAQTNSHCHKLPHNLTCKSKNVIYFAQCKLCKNVQGSYVGQTQQPFHKKVNNHRYIYHNSPEKSPLAYHSTHKHMGTLNFNEFRFYILQQSAPTNLDRLENMYIQKFRCRTLGLNRCNILAT